MKNLNDQKKANTFEMLVSAASDEIKDAQWRISVQRSYIERLRQLQAKLNYDPEALDERDYDEEFADKVTKENSHE